MNFVKRPARYRQATATMQPSVLSFSGHLWHTFLVVDGVALALRSPQRVAQQTWPRPHTQVCRVHVLICVDTPLVGSLHSRLFATSVLLNFLAY